MHYISRVEIDTNNRKKTSELTHLGAYHNWIEQCFPSEILEGKRSRKLWRIDKLQGKNYLLIVSEYKPEFEELEKYGVTGTGQSKRYDDFLDGLKNGQELSFRLTANPVRFVKQDGKRGKVYPHITEEYQLQYLEKRAEGLGFSLLENNYQIVERDFVLLKKKGGKKIRLARVTYEGRLAISNIDIFREILVNGVGREKAYGFGMMTVVPSGK